MDAVDLHDLDTDGALQEAAAAAAGDTRATFLRKAGLLGGGLVGGEALLLAIAQGAQAATRNDVAILNFALTLEYLEAAFYTEAENAGALRGELALFAKVVGAHERAHVTALRGVLGSQAVKRPRFDFRGTTQSAARFRATAMTLEDTGVAAYKGQAPLLDSSTILKAALAIHSVEARHASWIRDIAGSTPAPVAFDRPKSKRQILAAVASTRFILPAAVTPSFTG